MVVTFKQLTAYRKALHNVIAMQDMIVDEGVLTETEMEAVDDALGFVTQLYALSQEKDKKDLTILPIT